ncbi:hypothetical protein A5722_02440 [Mycobacterium vulneris]|nr:hypothetical protein A5722_02440 [Mycolicibacterium vulneris]OCB67270.1 hypothetical protein A5729_08045 [Mycolicibacterium vulneris]
MMVLGAPAMADDTALEAELAPVLAALVPASTAEEAALVALDNASLAPSFWASEHATAAAPAMAKAAASAPVRFISLGFICRT